MLIVKQGEMGIKTSIITVSTHGMNPASATMCGMKIVVVWTVAKENEGCRGK